MLQPRTSCRRRSRLAAALLLAGSMAAAGPARALETWTSEELGIRLSPPRGWEIAPAPSADVLLLVPPGGKGQLALAGFPPPPPEDGAIDALHGVVDSTIESLKASIHRFKMIGQREIEVAGGPAAEIYFRGRVEGAKFRWVQTLFLRRERLVILMYTAPEERYTRYLGDYDQTIRSIRFLP